MKGGRWSESYKPREEADEEYSTTDDLTCRPPPIGLVTITDRLRKSRLERERERQAVSQFRQSGGRGPRALSAGRGAKRGAVLRMRDLS